nr:carbohydrate porin [Acinetobacter sp. Marseille-Q1620]
MNKFIRKKRFITTIFLSLACLSSHIFAEPAFNPDSKWAFGDWNGTRTALADRGYEFTLGYTGQFAGTLHTEHKGKGSAYADQWTIGTRFDLDKILDWDATRAEIKITHRGGQSLSQESNALSEKFFQTQEIYGRGQTWRLTDFWIEKSFLDRHLDIKIGRYGIGSEFSRADCLFQNLSLCGGQVSKGAGDQWYDAPVSQWAMRARYHLQPELYLQAGVFEQNPVNGNATTAKDGFNLSTDGSKGAIIPVEVVWSPKQAFEKLPLPAEYRFGYFYSTVDAKNVKYDYRQSNLDQSLNEDYHKSSFWVSMKQQLTTRSGDKSRGLTVMGQAIFFDDETSIYKDIQNVALVYRGLFESRIQDEFGLGVARIHINDDAQKFKNSSLAHGFNSEVNTELYYGLKLMNWFMIKPNIQYIHNIGANASNGNAWVGGVKFNVEF